jgi:hypothetical protein
MTDKAISPLRQRMIEDMTIRKLHPCPCCGGRMVIIETFLRGAAPRYRPAVIRIDTS